MMDIIGAIDSVTNNSERLHNTLHDTSLVGHSYRVAGVTSTEAITVNGVYIFLEGYDIPIGSHTRTFLDHYVNLFEGVGTGIYVCYFTFLLSSHFFSPENFLSKLWVEITPTVIDRDAGGAYFMDNVRSTHSILRLGHPPPGSIWNNNHVLTSPNAVTSVYGAAPLTDNNGIFLYNVSGVCVVDSSLLLNGYFESFTDVSGVVVPRQYVPNLDSKAFALRIKVCGNISYSGSASLVMVGAYRQFGSPLTMSFITTRHPDIEVVRLVRV